jgi:adenylate kinase
VAPVLEAREGYVLDGFPRTLAQTEVVDFDMVIYLDVPDEVLIERMLARGRADDRADVIAARLHEYARDTEPLIDHDREAGVLVAVDGHRGVDEVTEDLLQLLRGDRA